MRFSNFSTHLNRNPLFSLIAQSAAELGYPTYLVGGYVRDLLLGRFSKDIDVVCVGDGIKLAAQVAQKISRQTKVHEFKNFGTAMINTAGGEVEFVGARKESYRKNSRKPAVTAGTLEDDQKRRDFTINALAISLNATDYGSLLDPFGGLKHLDEKLIKTPLNPALTFSDDPLRMMRAIRFASQLTFDIEAETFQAIYNNRERIKIVSQERIIAELNKIILSPQPSYGFKLLFQSGLLRLIFPELVALKGIDAIGGRAHKDNFYHTLAVLDNISKTTNDLWLRWAAILHDIAKPHTKRFDKKLGWTFHGHEDLGARQVPAIFRRLKLPLDERMKKVQKLVRLHLRPIPLVKDDITDSAVRRLLFEAGNDIDDLMMLCRADITSKDHKKVLRYLDNFDIVARKMEEIEAKDKLRNFQSVIGGELIMQTFGLQPCRMVGEIKQAVREAILDGNIANNLQEAVPYMLEVGKKHGLKAQNLPQTNH